MTKKKPVPVAPVPAWIRMPREVLASDAWRSVGINGRRVIDFLMIELAGTAGTQNGNLKAPYQQLVAFGVGKRYVGAAIRQLETVGLVADPSRWPKGGQHLCPDMAAHGGNRGRSRLLAVIRQSKKTAPLEAKAQESAP